MSGNYENLRFKGNAKKLSDQKLSDTKALLSDPDSEADVGSIWTEIKSCLINACDSVCSWTKGNCKQERETWWWDETVESSAKQTNKTTIEGVAKGGSKE